MCGLVVATLAAGAWVAVGSPRPAAAAVWFQVTKLGGARYTGAPDQPFFALVLGTGARSDDPNQSGDDPGLADAVHVIGVNPALNAATIIDIPRDTEGPGGQKINSYIVTPVRQRPADDGRRGVVGHGCADLVRDPGELPELRADGRRDRRDRHQHPDRR